MSVESIKPDRLKKIASPTNIIFGNSKGGVGKSTLALMAGLGLATRHQNADIEIIDLDPQATSSDSLQRFTNERFSVVRDEDFFLASGSPNNGNIVNHIGHDRARPQRQKFIIFDSPAGSDPIRSSFLLHCDIIFVPTSVADADVFATHKFLAGLQELIDKRSTDDKRLPAVVILPNMVDCRDDFNNVRHAFGAEPFLLGHPLYYAPIYRRAFRADEGDVSVKLLLKQAKPYLKWLVDVISNHDSLPRMPAKLYQL